MATLTTASIWPIVLTTKRYISRYFGHIPARVTCSTGCSLEADLADAAQDKGDGVEESVATSTIDKECEAGACELGI